jgi:hypothetical protein
MKYRKNDKVRIKEEYINNYRFEIINDLEALGTDGVMTIKERAMYDKCYNQELGNHLRLSERKCYYSVEFGNRWKLDEDRLELVQRATFDNDEDSLEDIDDCEKIILEGIDNRGMSEEFKDNVELMNSISSDSDIKIYSYINGKEIASGEMMRTRLHEGGLCLTYNVYDPYLMFAIDCNRDAEFFDENYITSHCGGKCLEDTFDNMVYVIVNNKKIKFHMVDTDFREMTEITVKNEVSSYYYSEIGCVMIDYEKPELIKNRFEILDL